jgi:hypothetical protein
MYEYNINDSDNIDWLSKGKTKEKCIAIIVNI